MMPCVLQVVSTTKENLMARHGWKAADVVKKLEGARMANKSAHAHELKELNEQLQRQEAELQVKRPPPFLR